MRRLNLSDVELDDGPGRDGFAFAAAMLGPSLGASRIGAGLYEAVPGAPIWPYHYHHPDEEWLYVLDGAPVLRDPGGRRALTAGDLVAFPPGHRGAHTVEGPGRFLILSTRDARGPFLSVYPDSDKVSVFGSPTEPPGLGDLILPRAGNVDYWHAEGTGPVPDAPVTREPAGGPPRPVLSAAADIAGLGSALDADRLDGEIATLGPGDAGGEYRYDVGRETWLIVLSGAPSLEHAEGADELRAGDVVCLPDGPAGGRRAFNPPDREPARLLRVSTTELPAATHEPRTGTWWLWVDADGPGTELREPGQRAASVRRPRPTPSDA